MEKKNLTIEELAQVSGGVGGGTGNWSVGDRFSLKTEWSSGQRRAITYYFCTVTEILEPYPGSSSITKYVMHAGLQGEETGSFYTVTQTERTFTIFPGSTDAVVIKQIHDFPNCRVYRWEDFSRWV